MRRKIDSNREGTMRLIEETLSDGSKVFDIEIGNMLIPCRDEKEANGIFVQLSDRCIEEI